MKLMSPILILTFIFIGINSVSLSPPLLDEDIGQAIFHENKLYTILVVSQQQPEQNVIQLFKNYCTQANKGERLCTILSPLVQTFENFRNFIGAQDQTFFSIINVQERKKYVLPFRENMKVQDIQKFQKQVFLGKAEQFYSTEQPDQQNDQKCQRVVGKTLDSFLENESEINVLFLYTKNSACQVCSQMLENYKQISQKMYERKIVSFGYYDIFANNHPRITDEILPYFLIFTKGNSEPFGLQGQKFDELQRTIVQIAIKDTDLKDFRIDDNTDYDMLKEELQSRIKLGLDEENPNLEEL